MPLDISSALKTFSVRSHNWTRGVNENFVKMSMGMHPSVESIGALPSSATEGQMWINSANGKLCMWVNELNDYAGHEDDPDYESPVAAGWWSMLPGVGHLVYVKDQNKYYMYNWANVWELAIDIGATHRGIEREFSFYAPGILRPNAVLFYYVAGLEFTVAAGAPHSGAKLEVPASSPITFTFNRGGATVSFGAGDTSGDVNWPSEEIIQPSHVENMYVQAHALSLTAPSNLYGAQGLSLTLRGKIRPID